MPAPVRAQQRGSPPSRTASRGPLFVWASIGLSLAALLGGCYLTIAVRTGVSPVSGVLSDSIYYPHGEFAFVTSILLLGCGGMCLVAGMREFGMAPGRGFTTFFALWQVGLLACAFFPDNRTAADTTFSGTIHWCGGAVLFVSLPLACWRLLDAVREAPAWSAAFATLRALTVLSALTAVGFGASQVPLLSRALPAGLLQRMALSAEVVLLVGFGHAITRVGRRAR